MGTLDVPGSEGDDRVRPLTRGVSLVIIPFLVVAFRPEVERPRGRDGIYLRARSRTPAFGLPTLVVAAAVFIGSSRDERR